MQETLSPSISLRMELAGGNTGRKKHTLLACSYASLRLINLDCLDGA